MMLYADPGSGAMIWQIGLALFFGSAFYFTRLKEWTLAKLRNRSNDATPNATPPAGLNKSTSETE